MTNIKDIYFIDINWINKIISELTNEETTNREEEITNASKLRAFVTIREKLKPVTPLIEEVYFDSNEHALGSNDFPMSGNTFKYPTKQNYIDTKQFEL